MGRGLLLLVLFTALGFLGFDAARGTRDRNRTGAGQTKPGTVHSMDGGDGFPTHP